MSQYLTAEEFQAASLGVDLKGLPPGELDGYLRRASTLVEGYCQRCFEPSAGIVEDLYSAGTGRARIDCSSGHVLLYPLRRFPIRVARSLTWALLPGGSPQSLAPDEFWIEADSYGDGYRLRVARDFLAYRQPSAVVRFALTYDGGYGEGDPPTPAYPQWLKEATLEWAAYLLKKRGAQALVIEGSGVAVDQSALGGHLQAAQAALDPHRRVF